MSYVPPFNPLPPSSSSNQPQESQEPTGAKNQRPFQKKEKHKTEKHKTEKHKTEKHKTEKQDQGQVEGETKNTKVEVEGKKEGGVASLKTEGVQQKMQLSKVHEVIMRGVDAMRVSETGKVEIDLKTTANIPAALQGGTMSLSTEGDTTVIRFDNINVGDAQLLMENDAAKAELSRVLASKNINNARVELGENVSYTVGRGPEGQQIQGTSETMSGQQQDYLQQERGGGGGGDQGGGNEGEGEGPGG